MEYFKDKLLWLTIEDKSGFSDINLVIEENDKIFISEPQEVPTTPSTIIL